MPPALAESGLYAAVEELAESVPMPILLELDPSRDPLPPPVESAGYYVVSEALANALKHSQCRELRMRIARDNGSVRIEVGDDGVGGARPAAGAGLRGMAERIEALDGRLRVESSPGRGTLLVAELPCGS
jgi:signal transduction histidine kinase